MKIDTTELGGSCFPCAKGSKAPLMSNYKSFNFSESELDSYRKEGHAIGWLIPKDILVIDVDPRNGGNESFEKLKEDTGYTFSSGVTVNTPSGGKHIYLRKDESWTNRKTLKKYPGVDFLSKGCYVLTPGSPHPNGGMYAVSSGDTPGSLPSSLKELIEKKVNNNSNSEGFGDLNANNLKAVLSCIPITEFHGDRDRWFQLMASSHFATGGCPEAREAFLDWCVSDNRYLHDRASMSNQWDLLQDNGITTGTLFAFCSEFTDWEFTSKLFSSFRDFVNVDDSDFENVELEVPKEAPFGVMSLREIMNQKIEVEYLIEGLMTKYQPMVLGGPAKSLKTSITIDVVLSLASGSDCLGRFKTNGRHKIMFLSAESGLGTLQEKFRAAIRAKDIADEALDNIFLGDRVPRLDSLDDVITRRGGQTKITESDGLKLKRFILDNDIDVVFIDPLYLALPSDDSANLQAQGALLLQFVNLMLEAECTPVLLHHSKKTTAEGKPLTLNNLTGAGVAEFTRQWILLSRTSQYEGNGIHELHFVWGGSAGHAGYEMLTVNEGCRSSVTDSEFLPIGDPVLAEYTSEIEFKPQKDWRLWDLTWSTPCQDSKKQELF